MSRRRKSDESARWARNAYLRSTAWHADMTKPGPAVAMDARPEGDGGQIFAPSLSKPLSQVAFIRAHLGENFFSLRASS